MEGRDRHRSRSRHRNRSPSIDNYRRPHKHRNKHHKHKPNDEELRARKQQERLAKARLMQLQQEEAHTEMDLEVQKHDEEQDNQVKLQDELEEVEEDHIEKNIPDNSEIDPLDKYMMEIEKQAAPQCPARAHNSEDSEQSLEEGLDDEQYYEQFIQAFTEKPEAVKEPQNKPELLYDEEEETAWDRLLQEEDTVTLTQQKRLQPKRDLQTIDHSQIEYRPFRKDLFIPSPDLQRLTYEEVVGLREEIGDIKVRGKRCPPPILNWYQCGLSNKVLRVLEKKKYKGPFPIQAQAITAIMSGRDVIGIAETGSGKTMAYLLPMFRHILDQPPLEEGEGPIALVLAPTRELAFQIYNQAKSFTKHTGLRCVCVYGGSGLTSQLSALKKGAEIVVCTPGRMIDVLCLSNGRITNLKRVTYVVIDEADRMFDMGFEPQISKIVESIRPDRQTVMFSATFAKHVERLAKNFLTKPVEIIAGVRNQTCQSVEQFVEVVEEDEKYTRLAQILEDWYGQGNILIFVERQNEADDLFKELMKDGYETLVLHGGHDQTDRDFTISDFKSGTKTIMVATSIAARGIDVKHLVLVVNYTCPNHMEDYIHRIGRTGRAGSKGTAITLITEDESKYAWELIKVLEASGQEVPEELQDLALEFKQMVEDGEAKPYRSRGFGGKGFKFSKEEVQKVKDKRKKLKKDFFSDSDTDASEGEEPKPAKKSEMTIADYIKDPKIRAGAMSAAQTAAKAAIMSGNSSKALSSAREAIELVVMKMKKKPSQEEGMDNVLKIRDEWVVKSAQDSGKTFVELDINDYPLSARTRVMSRDYLNTINDLTGCSVSVRGTYVDPSKKTGIGQRRLHLFIEGPSAIHCNNARNEIKRFLEDLAPSLAIMP